VKQNKYFYESYAIISIILPALNEEKRISSLLNALRSIAIDPQHIELIVVDDGSTDGTSSVCQQIIDDFFPLGKVITKSKSTGKGSALRIGVAAASAPIIITMDADMATDLSAVEPAMEGLQKHHIVVGSRSIEGARTQGITAARRFVTIGFSFILRILTRHEISDTQCGFKAYRSPIAKILFSSSRVKGFAQDAEILDLAYRHNLSILEIPVHWTSIAGSKVNLVRDSTSSFLEFIWYQMRKSKIHQIDGLSVLDSESKGGVVESEILSFFPPSSIYIRCQATTDILMPGICLDEIKKMAEAFRGEYPGCETYICSRTLSDLSSLEK
jgi:glycosyltransferase involved in cell wall biosynthesis